MLPDEPTSDLYLIRHAQSTWNAVGRWQGQADPPLSLEGERQADELAARFPHVDVQHLVTSDLERARCTAQVLGTRLGIAPTIDPDLREIDVGTWTGRTRAELHAEDAVALEEYFQGRTGWRGGETYAEHEVRCDRAARRLDEKADSGSVVAVTHGGTLRAIVLSLLEIDHAARWRFTGIGHTSTTHLRRFRHGWRLVTFNALLDLGDA